MSGRFLVCLHDVTPAYARETRAILGDLAPLLGRRVSLGVVPDWYGEWPLTAYPDYCRLVRESSEELLLHGYFHQRRRGGGPATLIAGRSDEMNGLDAEDTRRTVERGQRVFIEVFGEPARGFVAPAWQRGHVRFSNVKTLGLDHVLGYFALESSAGRRVPLATWTWDCGRWCWLGHIGHGIGWLSQSLNRGVPTWRFTPGISSEVSGRRSSGSPRELVDIGYEPSTAARLLEASEC